MNYDDYFGIFYQSIDSPNIEEIENIALPTVITAEQEGADPYSDLLEVVTEDLRMHRLARFGQKTAEAMTIARAINEVAAEQHRLEMIDQYEGTTWRTRRMQQINQQCHDAEAGQWGAE